MAVFYYFLKEKDFPAFFKKLLKKGEVYGPKAKGDFFVFDKLKKLEELRLDYDVTILPPKKIISPPEETLLHFSKEGAQSPKEVEEKVLFGVHFYDIKAIDMLDLLFQENFPDSIYLSKRKKTTIIGSSIERISKRAFWGSVGKHIGPQGHDGFFTKIKDGYLYETLTEKGEKLLKYGEFQPANSDQIKEAKKKNKEIMEKCPEKLIWDSSTIAKTVRENFKSPLWEILSKKCFSCGTCNMVCPTCYCFDVQDYFNFDGETGTRKRHWDGCLLEDFAKITLGGGACENFRGKRYERYRHRAMRKTAYLNTKLGGPACVGCGRCSMQCVPDIADPVNIIKSFMEVK
ncbi:MAG: 4Fe-4S dicluster domain-containing protein [Thermoanaerobaculia bacterium]